MNLVIMQPYFLPYVGYFSLFDIADTFVIYDDVNYIKKGWINRNNFLSKTGPQRFTLPIRHASQNAKICDLELLPVDLIKTKFFKMLSNSYAQAPYYQNVKQLLVDIFDYQNASLADFLVNALKKVVDYLSISINIIRSSQCNLSAGLSGMDRIIDIAENLKAKRYINAIGGVDLYSQEAFQKRDIELLFLKHNGTNYSQFLEKHVPNLSIIDVLMFNSPKDAIEIIQNYELING